MCCAVRISSRSLGNGHHHPFPTDTVFVRDDGSDFATDSVWITTPSFFRGMSKGQERREVDTDAAGMLAVSR